MKERTMLMGLLVALAIPTRAAAGPCVADARIQPDDVTLAALTLDTTTGAWAPTIVTLNGSPSKGDAFSWAQRSGPTVSLAVDPKNNKATFTAPAVGQDGATLVFELTASCGGAVSKTTASVKLTYVEVNAPPKAAAVIAPSTVNAGDPFTLDGSGSSDPDGDALTFTWELKLAGGTWTNVASAATASLTAPSVPYPDGATFTYRLTVSDGTLSDFQEATLTVKWVDDPPVANATCTSPVKEGDTIDLDRSGSGDPDDGVKSYVWAQRKGGPTITLPDAATYQTAPIIAVTAPEISQATGDEIGFDLTVTDNHDLYATSACMVTIVDARPPELTVPQGVSAEATSALGAAVSFTVTAVDAWDGALDATRIACLPASGSTFPLGKTTVSCSAKDAHENEASASFEVAVVDTTPPALTLPADLVVEATKPAGADVTFTASASDLVDGSVPVSCSPASGGTFALDQTTTVTCTATDAAKNVSSGSFAVTVRDTTPPAVTPPPSVVTGPTEWDGALVSYGAASASDLVDGAVAASCAPASNGVFRFGTTTVTCTATDAHRNSGSATFTVQVTGFTFLGFYQPVDNLLLNTVKAGATVPVKFKLQGANAVEITDTRAVDLDATKTRAVNVPCTALSALSEDAIELTTTGGTSLRYDTTSAQFVFNWQTPARPATCWRLELAPKDGTPARTATFKLK